MSKARCNYHHGDLRNALIVAAAELIERDDTLDFTMAEAAERAGVSAAAPYRHFADKEELLRGVRELAILGLGHAAGETVLEYPHGSLEGILAMGHMYLQPTPKHATVDRFVEPAIFESYSKLGKAKGFLLMSATPLTRSSYHADADFAALQDARNAAFAKG